MAKKIPDLNKDKKQAQEKEKLPSKKPEIKLGNLKSTPMIFQKDVTIGSLQQEKKDKQDDRK